MNSQPEDELQRRLQKLEAKMNSFSPNPPQPETQKQTNQTGFAKLNWHLERFQIWFQSLSGMKKLAVTGVGILVGILVLQTVFKLVASVISLALLALLVYLGYKFLLPNSFQRKQ
ncbi:hypothetical protein H6G06_26780 [Anabaena sphaerica FACHB-251]|uniref:Uncharacterized protein n=1 Tax=Anabaena sphaerica FACHB-251 TaxID=2692883 RepID=A0A926WP15_9NOST|nr:hypothetical protein [Anabaena sphaerica]MBD2296981.1 hypothetical protein [Anabaena sphaerica FACHB-251]